MKQPKIIAFDAVLYYYRFQNPPYEGKAMQNVFSPLASVCQTQLEASRQLADTIFAGTQKIDHIMLEATHQAFTDQLEFVQELTTARDPGSLGTAFQSRLMARNSGKATEYQRQLLGIVVEMQSEIGRNMQNYVEQIRNRAVDGMKTPTEINEAARDQPTTDGSPINPLAGMFSVWENAFKDAATLARRNMSMAGSMAQDAAKAASDAAASNANVIAGVSETSAAAAANSTDATADVISSATDDAGGSVSSDKKGYPSGSSGKKK
ncbi:phasin family protein [Noviherbaspirillum saxi]|uniref:Phasin family protein n=1 Tax=Noviherbaspirillum saxi TaxID=2320863 RepID=A0A3A3FQX3_9BURK|nr:phasin family protein [Noviherbaspirillum saxi]RJF98253.1 phasin family protein [Noviherbaspirillum saxi]